MPGRAASQRTHRGGPAGALWRGVVAAIAAGALGTVIHASLSYLGDVPLPWGVGLAWLFLGLLVYWAATAAGRLWGGALGFLGCYVVTGLLAFSRTDQLLVPLSMGSWLSGPALASTLWLYGMIIPGVVGLLLARRALAREARRETVG